MYQGLLSIKFYALACDSFLAISLKEQIINYNCFQYEGLQFKQFELEYYFVKWIPENVVWFEKKNSPCVNLVCMPVIKTHGMSDTKSNEVD